MSLLAAVTAIHAGVLLAAAVATVWFYRTWPFADRQRQHVCNHQPESDARTDRWLYHVDTLDGRPYLRGQGEDRVIVDIWEEANAISSEVGAGAKHSPVLDLDFPARLVPSSTPGHFHLYLEGLEIDWETYAELLTALAKAGVIEDGYAAASVARRASFVRKPGVYKRALREDFDSSESRSPVNLLAPETPESPQNAVWVDEPESTAAGTSVANGGWPEGWAQLGAVEDGSVAFIREDWTRSDGGRFVWDRNPQ
jgi:hypothetical protein